MAAAVVVVGLIGALAAEAAGSIAGKRLYRNRCVPQETDKPLRPQAPDFGLAESILKPATATPSESPKQLRWPQNWMRFARLGALPCYPLKIANRQEIYHEPPGY
jgi:hypothetical protein